MILVGQRRCLMGFVLVTAGVVLLVAGAALLLMTVPNLVIPALSRRHFNAAVAHVPDAGSAALLMAHLDAAVAPLRPLQRRASVPMGAAGVAVAALGGILAGAGLGRSDLLTVCAFVFVASVVGAVASYRSYAGAVRRFAAAHGIEMNSDGDSGERRSGRFLPIEELRPPEED